MVDQEVVGSQLKTDRFPFQSEGDITLAVRNANYSLGPVMLHIVMKPNAVIPAHVHKGMAEALFVVEGDFINEGKQHLAGTSLHFKVGKEHGPHTTKNGCKLLVLWTDGTTKAAADLSDFIITKKSSLTASRTDLFPATARNVRVDARAENFDAATSAVEASGRAQPGVDDNDRCSRTTIVRTGSRPEVGSTLKSTPSLPAHSG
jgi:ChrR Cupin-like domain